MRGYFKKNCMKGKITDQGHYELFISERGHRLLMLNDNLWFRWDWDTPVQKLYLTKGVVDKSGDKEYTAVRQGKYYMVEASTGEYSGFPHLLLEDVNFYDIFRLPTALPSNMDFEAEIIDIREKVPAEEVDSCFYQISE